MTETRRPLHLGALLGGSAACYGVVLAGVAWLQSTTDTLAAAERAPSAAVLADVTRRHDALETDVQAAAARYAAAATAYQALTGRIGGLESSLGSLQASVAEIRGASTSLPTRVSLPTVSRSVVTVTRTTVVHATTGASTVK